MISLPVRLTYFPPLEYLRSTSVDSSNSASTADLILIGWHDELKHVQAGPVAGFSEFALEVFVEILFHGVAREQGASSTPLK